MAEFCDNPKCKWHINTPDEEIHVPEPVGRHLEHRVIRRRLCRGVKHEFYLCDDCKKFVDFLRHQ